MDKIHDPESRAWISPKIEVGPYFEQLSQKVAELKPVKDTRDVSSKTLMRMMGMEDKELFSQLEEVMKVDNLTCEEEVEAMQISDPILENIHGHDIPRFYKTNITPTGKHPSNIVQKTSTFILLGKQKLKTLCLQDEWLEKTRVDRYKLLILHKRILPQFVT